MYNNIPTKVLTGEVRLSYCHLDKPYSAKENQEPKYSVALLIPKSDTATVANIQQSIKAAEERGKSEIWKGFLPKYDAILHDGDGTTKQGKPYGKECHGCWVLNANSKTKPMCVAFPDLKNALPDGDVYSGCYARVTINFYPYAGQQSGVACGLSNVLKIRDGEPLGGGATAESDFGGLQYDPLTGAILG